MSIDMGHLADNQEAIRLAAEAILEDHFVVRTGYDFSADAFKFNGGFGALMAVNGGILRVDYSYSDGGDFGQVHRWTATVPW